MSKQGIKVVKVGDKGFFKVGRKGCQSDKKRLSKWGIKVVKTENKCCQSRGKMLSK